VYGLQAVPSDDSSVLGQRFEDIAGRYVREIREFQSSGPYLVVGECQGGALAYEVAQQLRSTGEAVALLALIDAFPPGEPRLRPLVSLRVYKLVHRARILALHFTTLRQIDMPARQEYVTTRVNRILGAMTARVLSLGGARSPQLAAQRAFKQAFAVYQPRPYTARAVLFHAATLPWGIERNRDLGWGDLVRDLEIEELPAYFTTTISEPRVRSLAERLARSI
jgi:thioesterase domain-containing protein